MASSSLSKIAIPTSENNLREDNVVLEIPLGALHPADFGASTSAATPMDNADRGQISDEEAACRICLDDISTGGETLLLQCSCRGELALVHRECAIKWFSRKGNNMCEVCHHIIQNLPLDLLTTISTTNTTANQHAQVGANWGIFRMCQEVQEFVVANVFAYFFFLLYFLVDDMGDVSLIVSLLLSCLLGYLSSATSTTMARGRYIWLYGVVQFSCVAISTYTLHLEVKYLEKQPLICVLFGSMVGYGVTFCCGSIVVGTLKIRRWWVQQNLQGANNNS